VGGRSNKHSSRLLLSLLTLFIFFYFAQSATSRDVVSSLRESFNSTPSNHFCADCGAKLTLEASSDVVTVHVAVTLGVFICTACADFHETVLGKNFILFHLPATIDSNPPALTPRTSKELRRVSPYLFSFPSISYFLSFSLVFISLSYLPVSWND
jgi:hypothetical protein